MSSCAPTSDMPVAAAPLIGLVILCLLGASADPEAQLEDLRDRIRRVQADIESQTERRDEETASLRKAERDAAAAARALRATETRLKESRARQAALKAEVEAGRRQLESGQKALSSQIRAVYTGGRAERLRLLMNQEDPARAGRILVYYRYLSDTRVEEINRVTTEIKKLARAERDLAANTAELETLATTQADEARELKAAREARSGAVARLDARIRDRQSEAKKLAAEAATLEALVEELRRALVDLPEADREAFSTLKGKLDWPTAGVLINDYGQPRAGGSIKWNGVVIGTDRGRDVRAIYHGRVAYADWLPGMGLLLVIEHGDGYMSLYGHNETLYKRVGDWVEPGEVVAGVGDTGGKSRSALYFEIRREGHPENPHRWFRNPLSAG
jgi:septal ring factor EnvC (AmiA/AmiB activator)